MEPLPETTGEGEATLNLITPRRRDFQDQEHGFLALELLDWLSITTHIDIPHSGSADKAGPELCIALENGTVLSELLALIMGEKLRGFHKNAKPGSFKARENIVLCMEAAQSLGLFEEHSIVFEDIEKQKLKNILRCLLDIARIGIRNGIAPPPSIIREQLEKRGEVAPPPSALVPETENEESEFGSSSVIPTLGSSLSILGKLQDNERENLVAEMQTLSTPRQRAALLAEAAAEVTTSGSVAPLIDRLHALTSEARDEQMDMASDAHEMKWHSTYQQAKDFALGVVIEPNSSNNNAHGNDNNNAGDDSSAQPNDSDANSKPEHSELVEESRSSSAAASVRRFNPALWVFGSMYAFRNGPRFAGDPNCRACSKSIGLIGSVKFALKKKDASLRYHCCNCGNSFCAECSSKKAVVPFLQYDPSRPNRVCDNCFGQLTGTGPYKPPTLEDCNAPLFSNLPDCIQCGREVGPILSSKALAPRHHCRCCGFTVCQSCSPNVASIPFKTYSKEGPQRVCEKCNLFLETEDGRQMLLEKLFLPIIVLEQKRR
eukprot:c14449_g1_i1.p1 GENE.c14449_g1_i1~~c14449_g1_i1.p1  ORF type:complete len:586 (-),score=121.56 c14449_g1_i1:53-1690(-)